jgi:DNA repair protein RadC
MRTLKEETPIYKAEKFIEHTTNYELLSIVLGGTNKDLKIAKNLYLDFPFLSQLSKIGELQLKEYGLSKNRIVRLKSFFQLASRIKDEKVERKFIRKSEDAFEALRHKFQGKNNEYFYILILNKTNQILAIENHSIGMISGTLASEKKLLTQMLKHEAASSVIISHNHPSGLLTPSNGDIQVTSNIKKAVEIIGYKLLDHLIIHENRYLSFADEGYL